MSNSIKCLFRMNIMVGVAIILLSGSVNAATLTVESVRTDSFFLENYTGLNFMNGFYKIEVVEISKPSDLQFVKVNLITEGLTKQYYLRENEPYPNEEPFNKITLNYSFISYTVAKITVEYPDTWSSPAKYTIDLLSTSTTIHTVCSNGCNYTKIQDAIDAATSGDTIEVYSGTYYENVNVNKQLTMRGIGMPVVDAIGSGSAITLAADGIVLEGFTAIRAVDYPEAGIKVMSNNNTLDGNNATLNNYGGKGYGIILSDATSNNTLIGNLAVSNNYGIGLFYSNNNTFIGNNASSNNNYGIKLSYSNNNLLNSNIASDNSHSSNIQLISSNNNTLNGNIVSGINSRGGNGISLSESNNNTLISNIASNHDGMSGFALGSSSNNTLSCNIASGNGMAVRLSYSSYNMLSDNNFSSNSNGIELSQSKNNTITRNNFSFYSYYGISLDYSNDNMVFNNIFNITTNVKLFYSVINTWNISKQPGTNIVGDSYLGGNFWANPSGTGFSQICADDNTDGICDLAYTLDGTNIDYLPLAIHRGAANGIITGTVTNVTSGAAISGATVTAGIISTTTNPAGSYSISIAPGAYSVTASTSGFVSSTVGVTVVSGETVTQNFALQPVSVLTSISVSPEAVSVVVGSTQTFVATPKDQYGNPISATVMWSSSNTTAGTINIVSGVFTAIAPGTTTITATTGIFSGTAIVIVITTSGDPSAYAVRDIERQSLYPGSSTNITVNITSNISQSLSLQEFIPSGWNLTNISDDGAIFKADTNEWIWFNVGSGVTKSITYKITMPANAPIGKNYINGKISNSTKFALVTGDSNITSDILSYYRSIGSIPNVVDTSDLKRASDDWNKNIPAPGFDSPITTLELLRLADEWLRN